MEEKKGPSGMQISEDALLTAEIREMMGRRDMMADCGMLGPVPAVPAAVKRRKSDPNP